MQRKPNKTQFITGILSLFFICYWLVPLRFLHAQEVELHWETVTPMNAAGETELAIISTLPATILAYEMHVTYNPQRIEILDVQSGEGLNTGFTHEDGALVLSAEENGSAALTAGQPHTFAKLKLKVKVKESSTITLARSTFIDADGDELNGTMLLDLDLPAPGSSPSSSQTQPSAQSQSSASSLIPSSQPGNGTSGPGTLTSGSSAVIVSGQSNNNSRTLKLLLASASLLLIAAIVFLLVRNKTKR